MTSANVEALREDAMTCGAFLPRGSPEFGSGSVSFWHPGRLPGGSGSASAQARCIPAMADLVFIGLTIVVFALLGAIARGVGRL
ncbi:hypothetical protein OG896_02005 [Streptomyces sp. NBC_00669]|uniref:hypothetical protein n=1 Tax=Streptomyces sp. NBC_00669 TaxID=2976011 RepID=UPI002E36B217|nr:hypothetical protein [Streptomyces sp. NBC_00669]